MLQHSLIWDPLPCYVNVFLKNWCWRHRLYLCIPTSSASMNLHCKDTFFFPWPLVLQQRIISTSLTAHLSAHVHVHEPLCLWIIPAGNWTAALTDLDPCRLSSFQIQMFPQGVTGGQIQLTDIAKKKKIQCNMAKKTPKQNNFFTPTLAVTNHTCIHTLTHALPVTS